MDMEKQLTEDALYVLLGARTIVDLEGWTQMEAARDRDNFGVSVFSPDAVKFCMLGALDFAGPTKDLGSYGFFGAVDALENPTGAPSVVTFNDAPKRTKKQVLAAFDKAIAKLETEIK